MMKMKSLLGLFVLGLALIFSPDLVRAAGDTFTVAPVSVRDMKAVFARVETADVITARARIGGTITALRVDEGQAVKKDAIIAEVTDPKLRLERDALEARVKSARAQKNLATTALERTKSLYASGTVAQARLDEAESAFQVAARNLDAVEAEGKVIIERQSEGAVRAPSSGRVLKVHVVSGAVILPGETIVTLAAEGYILRALLPERHARTVHEGDVVLVGGLGMGSSPEQAGDLQSGIVRQVYPEIKQGRVTADIEVEGLGEFFVGERVRVFVPAGERQAIMIPEGFISLRYGISFVRLADGGEVVVQTGQRGEGGIEALSGLRLGDVLTRQGTSQ